MRATYMYGAADVRVVPDPGSSTRPTRSCASSAPASSALQCYGCGQAVVVVG